MRDQPRVVNADARHGFDAKVGMLGDGRVTGITQKWIHLTHWLHFRCGVRLILHAVIRGMGGVPSGKSTGGRFGGRGMTDRGRAFAVTESWCGACFQPTPARRTEHRYSHNTAYFGGASGCYQMY